MVQYLFDSLQQQVFSLYRRGAYGEALALVQASAAHFPERLDDLRYWEACLASRLGDLPTALSSLQTAAAATARPELFTWAPEQSAGRHSLLTVLHGNGSRPEREAPRWQPAVGLGWLLAMPQSSQVLGSSRYGWNDLEKGIAEVAAHQRALADRLAPAPVRSVIGGFSRGAALAVRMALSGVTPVTGFVAVAPSLRADSLPPLLDACRDRPVRGYVVVGTRDFAHEPARELVAALRERGGECELEVHQGLGHDYPDEFAESLARALAFISTG